MLLDKIKQDQLAARKARDATIANVLGVVIAECDTKSKIGTAHTLTDGEVLAVIRSMRKRIGETITLIADKPDHEDDLGKCLREAAQLDGYIPQQLSEDRLRSIVAGLKETGMDIGKIMGHLKTNFDGQYDPKKASEIARSVLAA